MTSRVLSLTCVCFSCADAAAACVFSGVCMLRCDVCALVCDVTIDDVVTVTSTRCVARRRWTGGVWAGLVSPACGFEHESRSYHVLLFSYRVSTMHIYNYMCIYHAMLPASGFRFSCSDVTSSFWTFPKMTSCTCEMSCDPECDVDVIICRSVVHFC